MDLTGPEKSDTPKEEKHPYEPPHEWSQDAHEAFMAITDEDAPLDFEDGICGP